MRVAAALRGNVSRLLGVQSIGNSKGDLKTYRSWLTLSLPLKDAEYQITLQTTPISIWVTISADDWAACETWRLTFLKAREVR